MYYSLDEIDGGKFIVRYEILQYIQIHNMPPIDGDDLPTTALFGTEHHPDYFGDFPSPLHTLRGSDTRRRKLANGIISVETEQGKTMVAVCAPIWECDLSDYTLKLSEQVSDSDADYKFFPHPASSLALFELKCAYEKIAHFGYINWLALMNTIWNYYSEYAAAHNSRERHGLNDVSGLFFKILGLNTKLDKTEENAIVLSPEVREKYLRL